MKDVVADDLLIGILQARLMAQVSRKKMKYFTESYTVLQCLLFNRSSNLPVQISKYPILCGESVL